MGGQLSLFDQKPILGPRVGYQMHATNSEGPICTYAEAYSPDLGCQRCFEEFPPEQGYSEHWIQNLENRRTFRCERNESS